MSFEPPIDDELVNAVLDGEADDATVARVREDPALAARLAELRAVAQAVAEPVTPLSPEAVDQLVATALEAAGPRDELAQRRSRRGWQNPVARWAVAAAVVLVAAGGAALASLDDGGEQVAQLITGGDDADTESERSPADAPEEFAEERTEALDDLDSPAAEPEAAGPDSPVAAGPEAIERNAEAAQPPALDLGDLGAVDDPSRLAATVRGRLTTARESSAEMVPLPPCLDAIHRQADLPMVLLATGTATLDDAPAVVVVLGHMTPVPPGEPEPDPDEGAVVAAADSGTCEILLQAPLP